MYGQELVSVQPVKSWSTLAQAPGSGQIYDSNRPFMNAVMQSFGCDVAVTSMSEIR